MVTTWEETAAATFKDLLGGYVDRDAARAYRKACAAAVARSGGDGVTVDPGVMPSACVDDVSTKGRVARAVWTALASAAGPRNRPPGGTVVDGGPGLAVSVTVAIRHDTRVWVGGHRAPGGLGGARHGHWRDLRNVGTVDVDVMGLAAADAPVACRLKAGDGTWLAIRRLGDDFLRPVLRPGTWRPIGLDAFAEAARGGTAWPDDPFSPYAPWRQCHVPLKAYLGPATVAGRAHAESLAEACRAARAERLFLVDGEVHRAVPEPVLRLGVRSTSRGVTWSIGGMTGLDDVRPWARVRTGFELVHASPRTGSPTEASQPLGDVAYGLADLDVVRSVVSALHEALRGDDGRGRRPEVWSPMDDDVVRDVDPLAFQPSEMPAMRAAMALVTDVASWGGIVSDGAPVPLRPGPPPLADAIDALGAALGDPTASTVARAGAAAARAAALGERRDASTAVGLFRVMLGVVAVEAEAWLERDARIDAIAGFTP